jgi:glyoxylase-like metal-dependent hydrolase (beta-lactamase superfamily II)
MDVGALATRMKAEKMDPVAILLTHGHFDLICGIPLLRMGRALPVWIHGGDAPMLTSDGSLNGASLFGQEWEPVEPARLLEDGETIEVDGLRLHIVHTPGHSPGGITVDVNDGEALLVGDSLFRDGVGRTDLPGCDQQLLIASLKRIAGLHRDARVLPGHGPETTLARERAENPFLRQWLRR